MAKPLFTPKLTEASLCDTCQWATIVEGPRMNDVVRHCNEINQPIRFKVVDCNSYRDTNSARLRDMEKIAWRISADKHGNPAGFVDPKKFKALAKEGKIQLTPHDEDEGYGS